MSRPYAWVRAAVCLSIALCSAAAVLPPPIATPAPRLSLAADIRQFNPGNIISDAMFFDLNALTAQQTQNFIAAKESSCAASSAGVPCLKDYRETTFSRTADGICDSGYSGAANESAGMIIWKVGQACRVSPKVLLVLLQKEQALITASGARLTTRRYQIATGYGCPDTAVCDTQYYGFYNQVYWAAHQYQRYATYPQNYSYRSGANNIIQWSPTSGCGSSTVYIQNQATAGLYNYTPYRPNAAALNAGYGTGDGCSAYGNRNFWLYFTDWFGSTQSPGGDAVLAEYAALGGASGSLGPYTAWVICGLASGGCGELFQNGKIYWTAATGAHAILAPILSVWGALGSEQGRLGYPTSEQICGLASGGCGQLFQNGRIYSSPTSGTHTLSGAILTAWGQQGAETGPLGYPTGDQACGLTGSGCSQVFQNGRIYSSPTSGTHTLSGPILTAWGQQGAETGPLGYPTGDPACGLTGSGCKQDFQGGTLTSSPTAGTNTVSGAIDTAWTAAGAESGTLGYPTSGLICGLKNGGCGQLFQGGRIYSSPTSGTHTITGPILTSWIAQKAENGTLGYATSDEHTVPGGGTAQDFQGGRLALDPTTGTVSRN